MSVNLIHTPQQFVPQKGNAASRRLHLQSFLRQISVFAITLFLIWLVNRIPHPASTNPGFFIPLVVTFFYLFVALNLSIIIHELGHVIASILVGFRLVLVVAGPFRLMQQGSNLRFHFDRRRFFSFSGYTVTVPQQGTASRKQRITTIAGGPIVTGLQLMLVLAIRIALRDQLLHFWLEKAIFASFLASLSLFISSAIPFLTLTITNDDSQIIANLKGGRTAERRLLNHQLVTAWVSGTRPRNLDQNQLADALQQIDGSDEEIGANWIAYFHALDSHHIENAATYLDRLLAILQTRLPLRWTPQYFLEAAWFEARYGSNPEAARGWLALAHARRSSLFTTIEMEQVRFRAEAAVYLSEGKFSEALTLARRSLTLLSQTFNLGSMVSEKDWLEEIINETASANPLPKSWQPSLPKSYYRSRLRASVGYGCLILLALFCPLTVAVVRGVRESFRAQEVADVYYEHGNQHLQNMAYTEAVNEFNSAIEEYPRHSMAYWRRGTAYLQLGDYPAAIADFDSAIALQPRDYQEIYFDRGIANVRLERYQEAEADFNQFIAYDAQDGFAFWWRGRTYAEMADYEKAIADYNAALAQQPDGYEDIYYDRGVAYAYLDRYQEADSDYRRALQWSDNPEIQELAAEALEQLEPYLEQPAAP
jgi:tetratricopeptide (TPR) repeat protein